MNKNIVLIGMPGSGKTTLARLLSEKLNIQYVDLDEEIEAYAQDKISTLFEKGEKYFRDIESEVTDRFSKQFPFVIATGGGIILREKNMNALSENGVIIFLNRPLENIAADVVAGTRPLLRGDSKNLRILYDERIHLYNQYADIIIENNESPSKAVDQILQQLKDA